MDDRVQMIIIVWLAFAFLYTDAAIADEKTDLTTQNPGFISVDCGVDKDYLDEKTGLYYKSDRGFVSTGQSADISPEFDYTNGDLARLFKTLRYFPEGRKNCYTLKPEQGKNNNYIINVYFKYGNYDGKNQLPKFDFYLGVKYWATVQFDNPRTGFRYNAVHFSESDFIFVCLVNTGFGVPFISALELRAVNNSIYRTDSGFATTFRRFDVGNPDVGIVRYKDDPYDRIWTPYTPSNWLSVTSTQSIQIQSNSDSYKLPSQVLRTAVQPQENLTFLSFSTNYSYTLRYFNVYFYFAEVQSIPDGLKREFTITVNGVQCGPITPQYLKPLTVVCGKAQLLDGFIGFSINSTLQSDLPPILNGFEILIDKIANDTATSPAEVGAIMAIKQKYKIHRTNWQGDPCVPRDFSWNGLNCTTYNSIPRITAVDLGSSALSGEIASEFSNLQALQSLDLSNNELTGIVPEFLANLPNLVTLNLSGNRLTGPLPLLLIEKSRNGKLNLSFDQKSNPGSEHDKRDFLVPLMASIISLLAFLILVISVILWRVKIHGVAGTGSASFVKPKNRSFTYSEIVTMTDNLSNIIGEGGFGKVYLGELNDGTQVAVKLLSQYSKQGSKEFLSEVQLLIMVYHRNLVSLIGYCDDDGKMALVYEYMENGNLRGYLSDRSSYVLNWRERLQIAVESAQGLEYLHNGCKPPIVHRDLKTSNILLNENLVAKISDFGLSRVFETDKDTHVSTNPAGTFGYVDPEFYATGNLNKKSDVYSFGIILFELITGQPVVMKGEDHSAHILQWVTPMIENGDIQSIVDQRLEGEYNTESAWKVVEIAMSCLPTTAIKRPDMGDVLVELKECLTVDMASGGSQRMKRSMTRSSRALNFDSEVYPTVR